MNSEHKSLYEQFADKCRHFNGIQNDRCNVGVPYEQFIVSGLPCFKSGGCSHLCPSASFFSHEEVAEQERETNEQVRAFLAEMTEGKTCIICHALIENRYQVGRCVYANPCGHRQYQGTLPKKVEDEK